MGTSDFDYFRQGVTRYSVFRVKRNSTNKITGIVFIISLLLWIAVVIYAVTIPTYRSEYTPAFDFTQLDSARILGICGCVLLSIIFTFIAFIMLRCIPNITKLTLGVFWIPVPCSIVVAYYLISLYSEQFILYSIVLIIASILSCILYIVLLQSEGFHMSEKVIKETCKMMIAIPSTLMFALFFNILIVLLTFLVICVAVKLFSIPHLTAIEIVSIFINFIFGFWTVSTVATLHSMTLGGTLAEYYWIEEKNRVSVCTVLHLFCINIRYHIGTAAMHFGLLGGFRTLFYLVSQAQSMFNAGASKSVKLFFFYNAFDPILFRILAAGGASICSIKDTDFYHSMIHTMNLFMNKPRRVLAVFKMIETMLTFTLWLMVFFIPFSTAAYLASISESYSPLELFNMTSWQWKFYILSMAGEFMVVLAFHQCFYMAFCTIILNVQEEVVLLGDGLPCESYAMSPDLHSALQHNDPPPCYLDCCSC